MKKAPPGIIFRREDANLSPRIVEACSLFKQSLGEVSDELPLSQGEAGCARSARLRIPRGLESGELGGATTGATLVLHDVSTDALTLNTSFVANPAIFADLGTG